MRLIDADALFLHLRGNRGKETGSYSKGRNNGINIAIGAIRNEQICPTVDAVPVVRCEKCLYASQYPNENGMYKCGGILTEDGDCFLMVKPSHFCSYGERRGSDV